MAEEAATPKLATPQSEQKYGVREQEYLQIKKELDEAKEKL